MQLGQQRPGLGAQLLDEAAADFPVEAEGLGRPAAPVEGRHLLGDERLVQRVLGQQVAEFTDHIGVPAQLQLALDPLQDGGPAFLFQGVPHPRDPVAANPGERLAAPQPVRFAQQRGGLLVVAIGGQCVRLPAQAAELVHVDRLGIHVQLVALRRPTSRTLVTNGLPE